MQLCIRVCACSVACSMCKGTANQCAKAGDNVGSGGNMGAWIFPRCLTTQSIHPCNLHTLCVVWVRRLRRRGCWCCTHVRSTRCRRTLVRSSRRAPFASAAACAAASSPTSPCAAAQQVSSCPSYDDQSRSKDVVITSTLVCSLQYEAPRAISAMMTTAVALVRAQRQLIPALLRSGPAGALGPLQSNELPPLSNIVLPLRLRAHARAQESAATPPPTRRPCTGWVPSQSSGKFVTSSARSFRRPQVPLPPQQRLLLSHGLLWHRCSAL
jgi:hypothetical protein